MDESIIDFFRIRRPEYEIFSERLHNLLLRLLEDEAVKIHAIEHRRKMLESVAGKVSTPGKRFDGLEEIGDLSGLRVICYYTEDVDRVGQLIEREFTVDSSNSLDKLEDLAPDQFGYRSKHYLVTLAEDRSNLAEWRRFAQLKAEIQGIGVRSCNATADWHVLVQMSYVERGLCDCKT